MKTMSAVANGPRKSEMKNQANLEQFFCSARPALIRATANQKKAPADPAKSFIELSIMGSKTQRRSCEQQRSLQR